MYTVTHHNVLLDSTPDPTLKDFFKQKQRFADLINCLLFHGQTVLRDEDLSLHDSNSSTVFHHKSTSISVNKTRDILMKVNHGDAPILIGLENQQTIDYTMPFRILLHDTITYNQQLNTLNPADRKSFHPLPVTTCVLYYGDKKWIQPHSLTEIMKIPNPYREMINDWNGHIYDIKEIDINKLRQPENYMMIKAVQTFYSWDRNLESLRDMILTKEVAVVVATVIGNKKFSIKVEKEESEEINMCTVFDEYVREREIKGKVSLLLTQLRSKFGAISDELIMKLESSTTDELNQVTLTILNAKTEEDIMKIFG